MESVRGLLRRGKSHLSTRSDVEAAPRSGFGGAANNGVATPSTDDHLPTLISPSERLNTFRLLIGITNDRSFSTSLFSQTHRTAPNIGIYNHIITGERQASLKYRCFSVIINLCLGLQLVVAAALTALGASQNAGNGSGPNNSVTALGAINTVIAGLMTYLKGSGLPGRFKYYHNEWKKIREFIEQRERELSRPDCQLDVYQVINTIESMYDEIIQDIEASVPDSYHSATQQRRDRGSMPALSQLRGLPGRTHEASGEKPSYTDRIKEVEAQYGGQVRGVASEVTQHMRDAGGMTQSKASETTHGLRELRSDVQRTEREVREAVESVEDIARRRLGLGAGAAKDEEKQAEKEEEKK